MPVEIRLHPSAEKELRAAYLWYLERNRIVAEALQLEIDHAMEIIAESPNRWPRLTESERRYILPRFPFSLVYRVRSQFIELIAVAHQKRKPGYWSRR